MAGMRDVLIHDYIDVDLDIVWKTALESIPVLKLLLQNLKYLGQECFQELFHNRFTFIIHLSNPFELA